MGQAQDPGGEGVPSGEGNHLIIPHTITRFGFITTNDADGYPITEPAMEGTRDKHGTAEWVWQAKSGTRDYRDIMNGVGFE